MKSFTRDEIHPIKMEVKPPKEVVNCGMKIINSNGFIYDYVDTGWVKTQRAERKDYLEIPQLIN